MRGRSIQLSIVCLLSTLGLTVGEVVYTVNIISDPPHDPFTSHTSVLFSCMVDPPPPEPVTYQWRVLKEAGSYSNQFTGQNITENFNYDDLRFSLYFCKVFSNDTYIVSGQRQVEILGLFNGQVNTAHYFMAGGDISLNVEERDFAYYYGIQSLTWYHNNTEITENQRIAITDNDRRLNITSAHSSDAGIYQARMTGLSVYGTRLPACDSELLPLLETHNAAFAPITFLAKEAQQCEVDLEYSINSSLIRPTFASHYIFSEQMRGIDFLMESSVAFSRSVQFNTSLFLDLSYVQWFHNGAPLSVVNTKYNATYTARGDSIDISLLINNVTNNDFGVYSCIFAMNTISLLTELLPSCYDAYWYDYYDFLAYYLSLHTVTLARATYSFEEYSPPTVSFSFDAQQSTLDCTVTGGNPYPSNHTIRLAKNNIVLQTYGHMLSYNTSGLNSFGVYYCLVDSLHSSHNKSILIPQRVDFQILVEAVNGDNGCSHQHSSPMDSFLKAIVDTIKPRCNCDLTQDNFEEFQLSCLGYGQLALFSATMVYSNDDGSVLASTLVSMLQTELEMTNGQALNLEGTGYRPTSTASQTSLIAGIFIAGWVAGLLTLAAIIGIAAGIFKLKKSTKSAVTEAASSTPDNYATSDEMKMAGLDVQPNSAYEAVEISHHGRYEQPRPAHDRRYQETPLDEVVYEVPA